MSKENKEREVKFCKNCFGLEPCWCDKKEYVSTWKFVYDMLKRCKG